MGSARSEWWSSPVRDEASVVLTHLPFAAEGAKVVVNDIGAQVDGSGSSEEKDV